MSQPATISPVPEDGRSRPLVSVITATLNAAAKFRLTLESVAGQEKRLLEHIVVDGGSTDATREVLEAAPAHVRWHSEPDGGIADAMNKGVVRARGEWIVILHAGDTFVAEDALASAVDRLTPETDVLACAIVYGAAGQDRRMFIKHPSFRLRAKTILHQGALCRRSVFERIGAFDTSFRIAMDYDFFLRTRNAGCRIVPCDMVLSRMDDTGISSRSDQTALEERFAEERRAQLQNCRSGLERFAYALYWPTYRAYRRIRRPLVRGAG